MTEEPNRKRLDEVLNKKPEFVNDTPLDRFFQELDESLLGKITDDPDTTLYQDTGCKNNQDFTDLCLGKLSLLYSLVCTREFESDQQRKLVPISLHDMKYFDELINLIVVHGIYANLPPGVGIPLEQRRLENFKALDKRFMLPKSHSYTLSTLEKAASVLYRIFASDNSENLQNKGNTIREILLKGTGYTDLVTAVLALFCVLPTEESRFTVMLDFLESIQKTYDLFSLYSLLVQTTRMAKCKNIVLEKLSTLAIRRNDGVISLIDFVVGVREDEQLNVESFNRVNQILVSRPKNLKSVEYFSKLFEQIYDGLTYVNRPMLVSVLNNLVTEFFFKNKRIVQDFLFKKVYAILFNDSLKNFTAKELNDAMNVLISLSKNTSLDVISELIENRGAQKFYLNLWIYVLFLKKHQKLQPATAADLKNKGEGYGPYYKIILNLIKTFVTLTSNFEVMSTIVMNLINFEHDKWSYKLDLETQLPYITVNPKQIGNDLNLKPVAHDTQLKKVQRLFLDIDLAIDLFIELLNLINNDEVIKNIFLSVMNRWVRSSCAKKDSEKILGGEDEDIQDDLLILVDLKLLEKMNESFKNNIIKKSHDVLTMVNDLLDFSRDNESDAVEEDSDDEEESTAETTATNSNELSGTFTIILELVSTILSTTEKSQILKSRDVLESIVSKLEAYVDDKQCQSLAARMKCFLSGNESLPDSGDNSLNIDRALLQKAMTNINDSSVPIRAHGLFELRQLIQAKSPVIDLKVVLGLHIHQLRDQEPFIYLNVIKGLTSMCELEPSQTLEYLLELYRDVNCKNKLDDLLKIGEVFMNYINLQNELFQGRLANMLIETCLEKIRQHEKLDNRLRMSAMSILGVCLSVNAGGIRHYIQDLLDCSFGILQLERPRKDGKKTEDDSKVLRRSAVRLIYDLLCNSGLSLFPPQYSGSNLKNLLEYVKEQDDDYLVCEQVDEVLNLIHELVRQQIRHVEVNDLASKVLKM